jgi:hypothetical protein
MQIKLIGARSFFRRVSQHTQNRRIVNNCRFKESIDDKTQFAARYYYQYYCCFVASADARQLDTAGEYCLVKRHTFEILDNVTQLFDLKVIILNFVIFKFSQLIPIVVVVCW